jgi:hypothetical protein
MIKQFLKRTIAIFSTSKGDSGTPCHYCPIHIFEEHEAGNTIHFKNGNPICARCRVLQSPMSSIILGDKSKRDAQMAAINERVQKAANDDVLVIAEKTQSQTDTKRKKK